MLGFKESPWIIHYDASSCNGCDIETLATLTPRYDLERFGVKLQGTPRHADVLICTGPVTRLARERLVRIYEQMPEPKFVVAVGTCCDIRRHIPGVLQYRRGHRRGDPRGRLHPRLRRPSRGDHRRHRQAALQPPADAGDRAGRGTGGGGVVLRSAFKEFP